MKLVRLTVWGYRCLRCDHTWVPRGLDPIEDGARPEEPEAATRVCPGCKSPYWDVARKQRKDAGVKG